MVSKRKVGGGTVDLVTTIFSKHALTYNKTTKHVLSYGIDAQGNWWRTNSNSLYRRVKPSEKIPSGLDTSLNKAKGE